MAHYKNGTTGRFRPHAIATAKLLAAVFGLAVLTHVSWNMFAPELFGLPELRIKQALGLVGLGSVVAILMRHALRRGAHG
ncbi:MAG: hypothetical protein ACE5EU_14315 [Paracoccaceae bacterium]